MCYIRKVERDSFENFLTDGFLEYFVTAHVGLPNDDRFKLASPAKAGVQAVKFRRRPFQPLDPGFRRDDGVR